MLAHPKFGFHTGPGGNPTGIGTHLKTLDAAGIATFTKAVDTTSGLDDALALPNVSGVKHTIVYRTSKVGANDGYDYDVPDYSKEPSQAAASHWAKHLAKFPPQIAANKSRVWVEVINEVRKENNPGDTMYNGMEAADWLGLFGIAIAGLAMSSGYNVALFGWSSGEPELSHWKSPGMVQFLQVAAANPERVAVALHEYSYKVDDIYNEYPNKIGRYDLLHWACDDFGIDRPTIMFTEWGWTLDNVPAPTQAMADIDAVAEEYAMHPNILGAAIWYLGPAFNGIANKAQQLIAPLTNLMLNTTYEVDDPTLPVPDPPPVDGLPRVDYTRIFAVIPAYATEEQAVAIFLENWREGRITVGGSYDDAMIGALSNKTARLYGIPQGQEPAYIEFRDDYYPGTKVEFRNIPGEPTVPTDPLAGIQLGALLDSPYVYTSFFDAPRDYDLDGSYDDKHEGIDADVLTAGDSKANVLAVYDGIVERSFDSTGGYGKYIRLLHSYNGAQFFTRYAHLDARFVTVGQSVKKGQPLGEIGRSSNVAMGEHVHFNIEGIGFGESGYVVAGAINPIGYLPDPKKIVFPSPIKSEPLFGLHASADPGELYGGEAEYSEFKVLKPGVVKVLSAHSREAIMRLAGENQGAEWIVRAFLDFGGRTITPQQFFQDTVADTERAVIALKSQGVPASKIWIELHNEPNLVQEGLGASWKNGEEFSTWLTEVYNLYQKRMVDINYIFPGLSPGWEVAGVRQSSWSFWAQISPAIINALDGIGVHAYWSKDFPLQTAVDEVAKYQGYGKPIWVTEASRNDRPAIITDYGTEYYAFVGALKSLQNVRGVTYFVASASNSYFHPECLIVDGKSKGWAAKIAQLRGYS